MPRRKRIRFHGAFYHVYNRGVEKRVIFLDDQDRKTFLQFLGKAVVQHDFVLFAYCLMENHFHLFLQTPHPNLNEGMQQLQAKYAQYFNLRHHRVGSLFQDRFKDRLVVFEKYALVLTRYIHYNPVKANLVHQLDDYPWSSYPSYLGNLPNWPWLNSSRILSLFHLDQAIAKEYFELFHQKPPPENELRLRGLTL